MTQQKETRPSQPIGTLCILLALTGALIILSGSFLFISSRNTAASFIVMGIGLAVLIVFGTWAQLNRHPAKHPVSAVLGFSSLFLIGGIFLAFAGGVFYDLFITPFLNMEHYLQVKDNPITVTAEVTKHDSYDNEDSTYYRSYISYIYNKKHYTNIEYQNKSREDDLTPLGKTVSVQVSPLSPGRLISELRQSSFLSLFTLVTLLFGLTFLLRFLQRCNMSKNLRGAPDTQTVQKDIQAQIRGRYMRPFLLLCWVGYLCLYLRYSVLLGYIPLIIAAPCFVGWLYCMFTTLRDYRLAANGDFTLHRDTLVDKREETDSDNNTSYTLYYRNGSSTWSTSVSHHRYKYATLGQTILAAYFPGKKHPIVHYDQDGHAR